MTKRKDPILSEIEREEKLMLLDTYSTAKSKVNFINELKSGLGVEIKKNPGKANIIKKTKFENFVIMLKKIFTNF